MYYWIQFSSLATTPTIEMTTTQPPTTTSQPLTQQITTSVTMLVTNGSQTTEMLTTVAQKPLEEILKACFGKEKKTLEEMWKRGKTLAYLKEARSMLLPYRFQKKKINLKIIKTLDTCMYHQIADFAQMQPTNNANSN